MEKLPERMRDTLALAVRHSLFSQVSNDRRWPIARALMRPPARPRVRLSMFLVDILHALLALQGGSAVYMNRSAAATDIVKL